MNTTLNVVKKKILPKILFTLFTLLSTYMHALGNLGQMLNPLEEPFTGLSGGEGGYNGTVLVINRPIKRPIA